MKKISLVTKDAVDVLAALAQQHRLELFRLLVRAGDSGLPAGAISDRLKISPSALSFHLAKLINAGLIVDERRGKSIIYRANFPAMTRLLSFLTEDCCRGVALSQQETEIRKAS